jgi:hypothetical protein
MTTDNFEEAIGALVRAENLLLILHERIRQNGRDAPSEELALTIRDGLLELKEKLEEEERKILR